MQLRGILRVQSEILIILRILPAHARTHDAGNLRPKLLIDFDLRIAYRCTRRHDRELRDTIEVIGPPRIEMCKRIKIADLSGNAYIEPLGGNDRDLAYAGTAVDNR
jgi:hypothetical protein